MELEGLFQQVKEHVTTEPRFASNGVAIATVLAVDLVIWLLVRTLTRTGDNTATATRDEPIMAGWWRRAARTLRNLTTAIVGWMAFTVAVGAVLVGAAYHMAGRNIQEDIQDWYDKLSAEQLTSLTVSAGQLVGLVVAACVVVALVRRLRPRAESRALGLLGWKSAGENLPRLFQAIERFTLCAVALVVVGLTGQVLGMTRIRMIAIDYGLCLLAAFALARAICLAARAATAPLLDLGDRKLVTPLAARYWERLARLLPLGERCLEATVYVLAATFCVRMMESVAFVADWGPRCVMCIGIYFGTRVAVELAHVLLFQVFGLHREDGQLDQRRQTLVPLLHSGIQYALYTGAVVMVLGVLDFNIMPILAGLGVVGVAVGLGAQNLVTDLVSGLFILFENQYLVGDYVEIAGARGLVEAIAVRHTQIRDDQGKLHIIPNGQIKQVINFSKGYVNAVVELQVPASGDVDAIIAAMVEAGRQLRQQRREILGDTQIEGLAAFSLDGRTVRAVTKVRPGTHNRMEAEYRRILQRLLDEPARARKAA